MVDGQQRATTISKYVKGEFSNSRKKYYQEIDTEKFLSYVLNVTELYDIDTSNGESLEDFYSLVNKRGVHLNLAEVNKAQYHDAPFMILVNELMDLQGLSDLDIFSTKTIQRMNDRSLIEEDSVSLSVSKENLPQTHSVKHYQSMIIYTSLSSFLIKNKS